MIIIFIFLFINLHILRILCLVVGGLVEREERTVQEEMRTYTTLVDRLKVIMNETVNLRRAYHGKESPECEECYESI